MKFSEKLQNTILNVINPNLDGLFGGLFCGGVSSGGGGGGGGGCKIISLLKTRVDYAGNLKSGM